jgi:hypothetical protein
MQMLRATATQYLLDTITLPLHSQRSTFTRPMFISSFWAKMGLQGTRAPTSSGLANAARRKPSGRSVGSSAHWLRAECCSRSVRQPITANVFE